MKQSDENKFIQAVSDFLLLCTVCTEARAAGVGGPMGPGSMPFFKNGPRGQVKKGKKSFFLKFS